MEEFKDLCLIDKLLHCITKSLNWDAHPGSDDKEYRNFWTDDEIEFRNKHFNVINDMSVILFQYSLKEEEYHDQERKLTSEELNTFKDKGLVKILDHEGIPHKLNWRECPKCNDKKFTIKYRDEERFDGVLCQSCNIVWNVDWEDHPSKPLYHTTTELNNDVVSRYIHDRKKPKFELSPDQLENLKNIKNKPN